MPAPLSPEDAKKPLIAFPLYERTRKIFLPDLNPEDLAGFRLEFLDVSNLQSGDWEKYLVTHKPEVLVTCWESPRLPLSLFQSGECSVRYLCHLTGEVKNYVSREMVEGGLIISNWGSTISYTIAEHALLGILASLRNITEWRGLMENSMENKSNLPTRSLRGKKIGIHGFGAIARYLVSLLKPFGVTISAYSAGVPAELFREHGVHQCKSLEELVTGIDIMVECEAKTPQTIGSVSDHILSLLPQDAVFVNVARGALVDEIALARRAAEGKIFIALDVYQKEPLALDSPLMSVPNALLSPHIAGPTKDAYPLCGEFALANLRRYLAGQIDQIEGRVTLEIYDRTT